MHKTLLALLLTASGLHKAHAQDAPRLGSQPTREVIAAMTLEEKARMLVGMGMRMPGAPPPAADNHHPVDGQAHGHRRRPDGPPVMQGPVIGSTQDKVPGAAGTTASMPALGIPTLVVADGPAGLRISPTRHDDDKTYYATAFPIATLLASSWDTDLVYQTGVAMGNEAKEYGVDILLGPGMNIHRHVLGGRNFEYYSEDPLLTGKLAAAMVNGIESNGVGTSIKHFAVNNHETNRHTINVKVSQRALREIYLRGFEIAIKEAQPWTVMSSYNKINGTYTSESPDLLQTILRQDWGFQGFVMTDWFGGKDAVGQMKASNELLMPGTPLQLNAIIDAAKGGQLNEGAIDDNLDRFLGIVQLSPSFKQYVPSNAPDLKAHAAVARRAAAEGMILLKNEAGSLPLKGIQSVAAFGNHSYDLISGGTGSGDVNEAYTVSLPDGLRHAGFGLYEDLNTAYQTYLQAEKAKIPKNRPFFLPAIVIPELALSPQQIEAATAADIAIITIGRISGEFADRKTEGDFYLTDTEKNLIRQVSAAFHARGKKVVVILNIGGAIEVASWRDQVDAILLSWLPGQEAGNAIADILTGQVNPSGKLATTFALKHTDEPSSVGFPGREYGEEINLGFSKVRPAEIEYTDGIYVGYRAFDKQQITPAYPFGYGLSYTQFEYSPLTLGSTQFKENIRVTVTVKNTGSVAGREVVQLYLSAPDKRLDKPEQELKGFAKTGLLAPGESQTLTFELDARSLSSFDEKSSAWVAERGEYRVNIGASSRDIKATAAFRLAKTLQVETVNRALPME